VKYTVKSVLIFLWVLSAPLAFAQQQQGQVLRDVAGWTQEITGSLAAARNLKVESVAGFIQVQGGAQNNITYTIRKRAFRSSEAEARRLLAGLRIVTRQLGDTVYIGAEYPGSRHVNNLMAEINITVPRQTALATLDTRGGSVGVRGIAGEVQAQTSGGSISLDDIGGAASAHTMGGSIHADGIGGDAKLETAGGSIDVGSVAGVVTASTSGGTIHVRDAKKSANVESDGGSISVQHCNGQLNAQTAGGSIEIGDAGAGAVLETAGGTIRLASANGAVKASTAGGGIRLTNLGRGVNAETSAGSIEAEFVSAENFSESHLSTNAGDIIVYVPSDLNANLRAEIEMANGHNIYSDFAGLKTSTEGGQWGPQTIFAEGQLNSGGPLLRVHTMNGNIQIRRRH